MGRRKHLKTFKNPEPKLLFCLMNKTTYIDHIWTIKTWPQTYCKRERRGWDSLAHGPLLQLWQEKLMFAYRDTIAPLDTLQALKRNAKLVPQGSICVLPPKYGHQARTRELSRKLRQTVSDVYKVNTKEHSASLRIPFYQVLCGGGNHHRHSFPL